MTPDTRDLAKPIQPGALIHRPAEPAQAAQVEPVAARYDFDGHGWRYLDSGSGSDWQKRAAQHDDCEWLYDVPQKGQE